MQGVDDVVRVQKSEGFFIGDQVDVEFCVMFMLLCVVGWERWDRAELLYVCRV
jgi:hypothetical protein